MHSMRSFWILPVLFLLAFSSSFRQEKTGNQNDLVVVKLTFNNNVKGNKIVFNDSTYVNPFGEKYVITKLRYYVTNVSFAKRAQQY